MKKINLLSIDGGGIRGILPGVIIGRLEEIIQKKTNSTLKIGDYFDLIAGTSTGGILSCLYLTPGNDGKALYSAPDALNLYLDNGQTIFRRTLIDMITSGDGIIHEKYSYQALSGLMEKYFSDLSIDKFIKPSLITSYDITERKAVFFTSIEASADKMNNFFIRDVARATAAAPTYFEPAHIKSFDGKLWSLIDGGVFANNPALCAYAEARKIKFSEILNNPLKPDRPSAKDMIIVSLGTGSVKKPYHYKKMQHAGEIKWLEPIIDILMSGNSETVDYQLRQMYLALDPTEQSNYYRLEPGLLEACPEMDIANEENIRNLKQAGLAFTHQYDNTLQDIADKIIENR